MDFFGSFQIVSLVLLFLIVAAKSVHMALVQRTIPFPLGVRKAGLPRLLELLLPVGCAFWMGETIACALGIRLGVLPNFLHTQLFDTEMIRTLGAIAVVASLTLLVAALVALGDSWRVGAAHPGRLVTTGVFSRSRNPVFCAFDLFSIGILLINGTPMFVVLTLAYVSAIHYQILQEERLLEQSFGDFYRQYCIRTPRYVTWRRQIGAGCGGAKSVGAGS